MSKSDIRLCKTLIPPELREDAKDFEVTYCEIDLNRDGAKELVAWESSWAGTSGGSLSVLAKKGKGFKVLYETDMTWSPIILLPTSHHGWRDLSYLQTGGGVDETFVAVIHDGKSYTTIGGPEMTAEQPAGQVLISGNWSPSVFGPISSDP